MKKIVFIVISLFCFNQLSGMRARSLSFGTPARKRSNSFGKLRKSRNSRELKESSVVESVRKAVASGKMTDEDVKGIRFFIALYERNKQEEGKKRKKSELDLSSFTNIDEKDETGRTALYKTTEESNLAIKEQGTFPEWLESKCCLLLSSGADPDEKCSVNFQPRSPRQIASPRLRKVFDNWKREGWSSEKQVIVEKGLQYSPDQPNKS